MILSTHIVADIEASCTQVAVLNRGQVAFDGTPDALIARAQGKVWEIEIAPSEYEQIEQRYTVISSRTVKRADGAARRRRRSPVRARRVTRRRVGRRLCRRDVEAVGRRSCLSARFAAYRLELRLTCWQWGYAALLLIWSAFIVASFGSYAHRTPQSLLLSTLPLSTVPFISIGVLFLAAISASRPQRSHFDALEWALPTGAEVVIARWLALVTAILPLLLAPLGVALVSGTLAAFLGALPTFLLETLVVLAFTAVLVWLIATFVGIKRWMYPLFGLSLAGQRHLADFAQRRSFPVVAAAQLLRRCVERLRLFRFLGAADARRSADFCQYLLSRRAAAGAGRDRMASCA